jgi:hypothetical protein
MNNPKKLDLRKELKAEYAAPKRPRVVETSPGRYLAIQGRGEPGLAEFQAAIEAIYTLAYTLKFAFKMEKGRDYGVMCLEAEYWAAGQDLTTVPKSQWKWRFLVRTPDFVTEEDVAEVRTRCLAKGKTPLVKKVKLVSLDGGPAVQMLHIGPYDSCGPTYEAMRAFAQEESRKIRGRCHEIYISDPRRVPPERLKTILRLRVR